MSDDILNPADRLLASWRSDVGRVRAVNEDSVLARYPLYLVADGMGGHDRGDRASRVAVDTIDALVPQGEPVAPSVLLRAVHEANAAVRADRDLRTGALSGTTLTGIALSRLESGELRWLVVNVGDSRVYSWTGRRLEQLTTDHSVVQEMVQAGLLSPGEAERHPERNTITRALGAAESVDVDAWLLPFVGGRSFVICSDGVSKELHDGEIESLLAGWDGEDGGSAADLLVERALASGGRDNVSVIVLEAAGSAEDAVPASTGRRELAVELDDTIPGGRF